MQALYGFFDQPRVLVGQHHYDKHLRVVQTHQMAKPDGAAQTGRHGRQNLFVSMVADQFC